MSFASTLRDVVFGAPLALPATTALQNAPPVVRAFAPESFVSLDDPNLAEYFRTGSTTSSGVVINEKTVMRNSAAFRASKLICSSIGMLPLGLFQKVPLVREVPNEKTGTVERIESESAKKASDHPVHKLLSKKPNSFQTPFEFWTYMVSRALFEGMAFAVKRRKVNARARGGITEELIPLNPKHVEVRFNDNWTLSFRYNMPNGPPIDIPQSEMFWFRSPLSCDGVTGAKLLDVAREALGLSVTAESATGRVLRNGALVGGVLQHPKALSDEAITRLRTQFEERQSGPENAGKWIVAEDGMEPKPFGTTLKDAQNAELRKFQIEEIARFTDVPRPLLMMDETSWGTGIEQLGLFFITYCLLPWFVTIEQAIWSRLLSDADQEDHYAKFNEGALLRGSLKDQAEFFAKALGAGGGRGWMTQNEVRDKFDQNAKEGGDELPEPITKQPASDNGDGQDPGDEGDASGTKPSKKPAKGSGGTGDE